MIYYAIALVFDFVPAVRLGQLKDFIFASLALPLALLTSLSYWSLRMVDRELAFPKALDEFFPVWLDYALHTNVSVLIISDAVFSRHQYPKRSVAVRSLTTFLLCYLIWLYVIFLNTGKWVYGVIGVLSAPQRVFFFFLSGLVAVGLYFLGEIINKCCNSGSKNEKNIKKKVT